MQMVWRETGKSLSLFFTAEFWKSSINLILVSSLENAFTCSKAHITKPFNTYQANCDISSHYHLFYLLGQYAKDVNTQSKASKTRHDVSSKK